MTSEPKATYGPWTARDVLGQGGNATVWRAIGPNGSEVALKVINETRADQESYVRFVREVTTLKNLGPQPGVLPMLDSHLPDTPGKRDRAWLTMPIATPIDEALEGRPLPEIVAAVAAIAHTLVHLKRDHRIAHRDLKPGNLYEREGQWLVGDFGLVAVPGAESLTGNGRQVGPAHFTAYEMIINPSTADPYPADVFSLGKTLWVLATGQRYAPEGHQPAGVRGTGVGEWRPHARAAELDQEISRMTQHNPEDRPSMDQVANDLDAWQELAATTPVLDLANAGARLRAKVERAMSEQDIQQARRDQAAAAAHRLQELFAPVNEQLKLVYPGTEVDRMDDEMTRNILKIQLPGQARVWDWRRCTRVAPLSGPVAVTLRVSRALELFEDGDLYLHLLVLVAPEGVVGQAFSWQPGRTLKAPVGSIEAAKMLEDAVAELMLQVPPALEVLIEQLPDLGAPG